MLPTYGRSNNIHNGMHGTSNSFLPEYAMRIINYPQMDLEYTFWQMLYLCITPSKVYKVASWHRQMKNQWARDDPAFVAIMIFFQAVSALAFSVFFRTASFLEMISLLFWAIFIDFILFGVIIATIYWWIANKYCRSHTVDQKVEWLYAFDIHCNSYFPLHLILYVLQFFLLPLLIRSNFLSTFISNSLYALAFSYYYHLTFLGYSALPFLQNTVFYLYPIAFILVAYVFSILFNVNATIFVMNIYFA